MSVVFVQRVCVLEPTELHVLLGLKNVFDLIMKIKDHSD